MRQSNTETQTLNTEVESWKSNFIATCCLVVSLAAVATTVLYLEVYSKPAWEQKAEEVGASKDWVDFDIGSSEYYPGAEKMTKTLGLYFALPIILELFIVGVFTAVAYAFVARWTLPMSAMFTLCAISILIVLVTHVTIYVNLRISGNVAW